MQAQSHSNDNVETGLTIKCQKCGEHNMGWWFKCFYCGHNLFDEENGTDHDNHEADAC